MSEEFGPLARPRNGVTPAGAFPKSAFGNESGKRKVQRSDNVSTEANPPPLLFPSASPEIAETTLMKPGESPEIGEIPRIPQPFSISSTKC